MAELLIGTVTDNNGVVINVYATESGGNTTFRLDVVEGYADLRGFFFDYNGGAITLNNMTDDAFDQQGNLILDGTAITASYMGTSADGNDITKVGSSDNNLNGTGEVFDAGVEIGTSGIGKNDVGSVIFTVNNLTLAEIDGLSFGIRATSVGDTLTDRSDSVKLIGEFEVPAQDTTPPTVTDVTVSDTLITDADAEGTFTVTVTFSEGMDQTINPALTFGQDVSGTLVFVSGSWTSATIYEATYSIADGNEVLDDVTIDVTGAKDLAGNAQADYTPAAEFSVDTDNPEVVSVDASDALLTDADTGLASFTVTVVFDQAMDMGVDPTLSFSPDVSSTLTFDSGSWSLDGTTYTANYDVADAGVDIADIEIDVTGAQDANGNGQEDYTPAAEFSIDTENPEVVSVDASDALITDADTGLASFTVTVVFDQAMDTGVDPTLTFDPDVSGTLSNLSGSWSLDGMTYTANYDVADAGVDVSDVEIDVEGAQDANGNAQEAYTPAAEFSIDTENPTVTDVSVSDLVISDADDGSTFTVTVSFSEAMGTGASPTLTFSPNVVADGTLSFTGGAWSVGDTVYTASYTVDDVEVDHNSVTIDVTGAQDANGNGQENYTPEAEFEVDTIQPAAPSLALDPLSDTGVDDVNNVTQDDTPTVRATLNGTGLTAPVAGDVVNVYSGLTLVGTKTLTALDITNDFADVTTFDLGPEGIYSLTATVTDAAGNESAASNSVSLTVDQTAPTDITWIAGSVGSAFPTGVIATLSTADLDSASYIYTLVSSSSTPATGTTFSISGNSVSVGGTGLQNNTTYTLAIHTADLAGNTSTPDEVFNIITGSGGSNTLPTGGTGDTGDDILYGFNNADLILGGADQDNLFGQDGNDTLTGGAGNDTMDGGAGTDSLDFSDASGALNFSLAQSSSDTTVDLSSVGLGTDTYRNMEGVIGSGNNDTFSGSTSNDILVGGGGNDILNGDAGADTLDGGAGTDALNGDAGTDTLIGGGDADTLNGGADIDSMTGGNGTDKFVINSADGDRIGDFLSADDVLDFQESAFSLFNGWSGNAIQTSVSVASNGGGGTSIATADLVIWTAGTENSKDTAAEVDTLLAAQNGTFNGGVFVLAHNDDVSNNHVALYYDSDANTAGGTTTLVGIFTSTTNLATLGLATSDIISH